MCLLLTPPFVATAPRVPSTLILFTLSSPRQSPWPLWLPPSSRLTPPINPWPPKFRRGLSSEPDEGWWEPCRGFWIVRRKGFTVLVFLLSSPFRFRMRWGLSTIDASVSRVYRLLCSVHPHGGSRGPRARGFSLARRSNAIVAMFGIELDFYSLRRTPFGHRSIVRLAMPSPFVRFAWSWSLRFPVPCAAYREIR